MSFKQQIHDIAYARLQIGLPENTSDPVLDSLDSEAWDIANAVANTEHAALISGIETLCLSIQGLTAAMASWVPGVVDAGGSGKGAVVAASNALGSAAGALKTLGSTYRG